MVNRVRWVILFLRFIGPDDRVRSFDPLEFGYEGRGNIWRAVEMSDDPEVPERITRVGYVRVGQSFGNQERIVAAELIGVVAELGVRAPALGHRFIVVNFRLRMMMRRVAAPFSGEADDFADDEVGMRCVRVVERRANDSRRRFFHRSRAPIFIGSFFRRVEARRKRVFVLGRVVREFGIVAARGNPDGFAGGKAQYPGSAVKAVKEIKTYLIKAGDTAWDIAVNNHVTFTDMKAINPGFDPFNIKIGEKIKLTAANPFLTLQTKEISNYLVSLPFGVSEQQTDALYKGERQVYAAGQPGIKNITSEIVRENGKPVSSRELVSKVTSEPVKQIVLTGTKNRPDFLYAASTKGKLGRPMASLRVSCAFGASRGSRRHEGIDFCTPVGTSVYASEGGVVTKAAREGSYGNVIFIKHGNGLETRYAHCSKLLVSAGQSVQRGQMIANRNHFLYLLFF